MLNIKQKKVVENWVSYWKERLFLNGWELIIEWGKDKIEKGGAVAECLPNFIYRSAVVKIYPDIFEDKRFPVKDIILHELIHIILDPYKQLFDDMYTGKIVTKEEEAKINEFAVSWIEQVISQYDTK